MKLANSKNLILIYQRSVEDSLSCISKILESEKVFSKSLTFRYKDLLAKSSKTIINKWKSGDKYMRTLFVLEAFSRFYPRNHLKTSLMQDAMVNILDDLLDETLSKNEKVLYILEYLRTYSVFISSIKDSAFFPSLSRYFNELIALAVAENVYLKKILSEQNEDRIVKYSTELLDLRSFDIDVFVEIGLIGNQSVSEKKLIIEIARDFRALNILKKDIKDLKHDLSNRQQTLVTVFKAIGTDSFKKYILRIVKGYKNRIKTIFPGLECKENKVTMILRNFDAMIKREIEEIGELIE